MSDDIQDLKSVAFSNMKSSIEEIIEEARNGRIFILVDDEDRENEGDLIIPAQMATPEAINFMATHGRGLICLTLTQERAGELELSLMPQRHSSRFGTAFTLSIEATEGVTTGISAPDRARTISVAIDAAKGPRDIQTPGHIFPLVARDGGCLERTGHTEASIDISVLAGLNPSAVICEIMNDDGTMARRDDLMSFAQLHGIKIGTIADLVAYRLKHDRLVERVSAEPFESAHGGSFLKIVYRNRLDGSEHTVLQKGTVGEDAPTLVRMHASLENDLLGASGPSSQLPQAMNAVAEHGSGLVVVLSGMNASRLEAADKPRDLGELRHFGVGAQILNDLGVTDMVLLSNSQHRLVGLEGYGLNIVEQRPLTAEVDLGSVKGLSYVTSAAFADYQFAILH